MLDKKQKEAVCELYDIELSKLPRLSDCFYVSNIKKVRNNIHVLSKDDKKALEIENNKIMKVYRTIITDNQKRCDEVLKFTSEPKCNLALETDFDDKNLQNSLFISNEYVGYFISKFASCGNENIIVKITVKVLGENLYNIQDEVIFVEDFDINRLRRELDYPDLQHDDKARRDFIERLWNTFRYSVEYFNHDYPVVDDIVRYKDLLQTKYKIDVDFSKINEEDDYTWENVGYKVYDNRLEKHGKIKTLRSQVGKM